MRKSRPSVSDQSLSEFKSMNPVFRSASLGGHGPLEIFERIDSKEAAVISSKNVSCQFYLKNMSLFMSIFPLTKHPQAKLLVLYGQHS